MTNDKKVPLLATACSFIVGLAMNHFWLAKYYGAIIGLSYKAAYIFIVLLLVTFHGWRAWRIRKGKSVTTKFIDGIFGK